jgi:uncharacterized protein (DUF2336 family)
LSLAQPAQNADTASLRRPPADRSRLMLALVDMCAGSGDAVRQPQVQELLNVALTKLVAGAEHDIRKRLADKLATADWPPPALVNILALDDIEIARPIIACSPLLHDIDLVKLLLDGEIEHQIEVAQRPRIGPPVVETIISQAQPAALTALAGNETAEISPAAMTKLVDASRELAALRSPLARHPRMTAVLAEKLYAWVGESLRAAIVSRFRVDSAALDRALAEAIGEARGQSAPSSPQVSALTAEQQDMERRLIGKLHLAGQLKPGYLLRALREKKLSLFEAALCALGDYKLDAVRESLNADQAEALALACAGVGVDRSAFTTILGLVRELNNNRPSGDAARARHVFDAFGPGRTHLAATQFRESGPAAAPRPAR